MSPIRVGDTSTVKRTTKLSAYCIGKTMTYPIRQGCNVWAADFVARSSKSTVITLEDNSVIVVPTWIRSSTTLAAVSVNTKWLKMRVYSYASSEQLRRSRFNMHGKIGHDAGSFPVTSIGWNRAHDYQRRTRHNYILKLFSLLKTFCDPF